MIFHTIQPTPGLDPARRRRANRDGPPAAAVRTSYHSLLHTAGFTTIEARDDTAEYLAAQIRWTEAVTRHEDAIRAALGDDLFDERLAMRETTRQAIEDGVLSRFRYSVTR